MKPLLSILLISSICLTQELQVDGDLKVSGTVESTTIDSLKAVIAQLQAQLAALQADNKLETRVYTIENLVDGDSINLSDVVGLELDYYIVSILHITPLSSSTLWLIATAFNFSLLIISFKKFIFF